VAGETYFPVLGDSRISSGFGGRSSPGGIGSTNHQGIDIATYGQRSPVVAPRDLVVTRAGASGGGYGNVIYARDIDNPNVEYRFGHLSSIGVASGQVIGAGQQIGNVGSTGNSTGNHLHFETRIGGVSVNPSGLLSKAKNLAVSGVKKAVTEAATAALMSNPATAPFVAAASSLSGVTNGLGLTGDCNWICQIQNWIKESGFFQRIALALLAFIIIFAGFYLLKPAMTQAVVKKALA